ncbi:hypothetical protein GCM10010339_88470 [Streptomyces alanosinicus]|uniref:Uncharacterized protein n=1 Tax=Streptomyces alanosinicus TaxID=68171 RepID=A0A919D7X9_9ACTN|nr:hypothetical protein GCM10010339_88470 [Streptomyces alanosinicus]
MAAFGSSAIYGSGHSLKGRTIRLTGFVTRGDSGTGYVTRLPVSSCAADATTTKVEVRGADAPATETRGTVTGTWRPKGRLGSSGEPGRRCWVPRRPGRLRRGPPRTQKALTRADYREP